MNSSRNYTMSQVKEDLFRKLVRELIKQELDEANSTGSVGGEYQTPHAFKGSKVKAGKKKKKTERQRKKDKERKTKTERQRQKGKGRKTKAERQRQKDKDRKKKTER